MSRTTDKIRILETTGKALEPDDSERQRMAQEVLKYAEEFLQNIHDLPAFTPSDTKGIPM